MTKIIRRSTGTYDVFFDSNTSNTIDLTYTRGERVEQQIEVLQEQLEKLQEEIIEHHLFSDTPVVKDVYSMSADEYLELPGNIRL